MIQFASRRSISEINKANAEISILGREAIQLNPQDLLFFAISYVNSLLDLFIYLPHKLFERESMCFDPLIPWPIFLYCFQSNLLLVVYFLALYFTCIHYNLLLLSPPPSSPSHHYITTTCISTSNSSSPPPSPSILHIYFLVLHISKQHRSNFPFAFILLSQFRSNYHKHKIPKIYLLSQFASRSNLALITQI